MIFPFKRFIPEARDGILRLSYRKVQARRDKNLTPFFCSCIQFDQIAQDRKHLLATE
jgi:hypothetical protein